MGETYLAQGDYELAIKVSEEALNIFKRTVLENHPNISRLLNNMGCVYREMKNYEKARDFLDRSLKMAKEKLPSTHHPDVAKIYNDIGLTCSSQGNLNDALKYFQDSLHIWKQTSSMLKYDHPDIVATEQNLSQVERILCG